MIGDSQLLKTRDMIKQMSPVRVLRGTVVRTYKNTNRVRARLEQSNSVTTCECSPSDEYAVGDSVVVLTADGLDRPFVIAWRGKNTTIGRAGAGGMLSDPEHNTVRPVKPTNLRVNTGPTSAVVMWRPPLVQDNQWFVVQRAKDGAGTDAESYLITQGSSVVNNDPEYTHFRVAGCALGGGGMVRTAWTSWVRGVIEYGEQYQVLKTGGLSDIEWDWPDQVILTLRNMSGGLLSLGDVVAIGTLSDAEFGTTSEVGYNDGSVGVLLEHIPNNATGQVVMSGWVPQINLASAATYGQMFKTHSMPGQATPVNTIEAGVFGQVLDSGSTPEAFIWNPPAGAGASQDLVTLASGAASILDLSGQEIDTDTQRANRVLAGPSSGGDAQPTFRRLVTADLPSGVGGYELLFSQIADGTLSNTTDEGSLFSAGRGTVTIPSNTLDVGTVIRITASGYVSDNGTPTLTTRVTLDGSEVCSTGAQALNDTISEVEWSLNIRIVCRSTGATGSVIASGLFEHDGGSSFGMVKTSATTVDTTQSITIDLLGTWGAAHADNVVLCQMAMIELLKADRLAVAAPSGLSASA